MMIPPSAGAFDGRVHHLPVRVYYEDTDFTGVVYHANYARFFERGRSDFLRLTGVDHVALLEGDKPLAFAVVRLAIDFLKAARIDDALVVRTAFDALKGPRIHIDQSIWRGQDRLVQGEVVVACIDMTGRPRRPPPGLTQRLDPYLAPVVDPGP
jgi:acyl-CoA thioester hydrolase